MTTIVITTEDEVHGLFRQRWPGGTLHLLIDYDVAAIAPYLRSLCDEELVYSIVVKREAESVAATELAVPLDTVPIFVVDSWDEAIELVKSLRRRPIEVVHRALNGDRVVTRYLEGFPS
jgi:hypothetical protein